MDYDDFVCCNFLFHFWLFLQLYPIEAYNYLIVQRFEKLYQIVFVFIILLKKSFNWYTMEYLLFIALYFYL
jgi:hypothetical protein